MNSERCLIRSSTKADRRRSFEGKFSKSGNFETNTESFDYRPRLLKSRSSQTVNEAGIEVNINMTVFIKNISVSLQNTRDK